MCPPKPSSNIPPSQDLPAQVQPQQNLFAQNPPPWQNPAPQNSLQMNVAKEQKAMTLKEILLQFEQQKGISLSQKRQQIKQMLEYEKGRPQILKKEIAKENALEGHIKCLKVGCEEIFPRASVMRMHITREHKKMADRLGNNLHECALCKQYSSLRNSALDKHQIICLRQQRAILVAQGQLSNEDSLSTEEELQFQRSQRYN